MGEPVVQASFSAGELGPSMYGRVDLAKYHVGLALCRNFFVDYRGGASNRAGTQFIGRCIDSSRPNRIISFSFSSTQSYALVFGNYTMRILYRGAELLEQPLTITAMTNSSPLQIAVADSNLNEGDEITILTSPGMPEMAGRNVIVTGLASGTFTPHDLFGSTIDATGYGVYTTAGQIARIYGIGTPYAAEDLALLKSTQSADTMTFVHPSYRPQKLTRNADATWTFAAIEFSPQGAAPSNLIGTYGVSAANPTPLPTEYDYVVTAIGANGATESRPSNAVGVVLPCAMSQIASNVTLAWQGVTGATAYNVYRTAENPGLGPVPGALFGFVGTVSAQASNRFTDSNIKPDFSNCPPQPDNPFLIGSIASIPVTNSGSGYTTSATITITDPTGYGAVATPVLNSSGAVIGVTILNGGQNYTAPVATISDSGTPADGLDPGLPSGGDGGGSSGGGGGSGGGTVTPPDAPIPANIEAVD